MTFVGGTARPGELAGQRRAALILAACGSVIVLLAPAIWNGFPLLQWDTGGYLARWYEGYLVPSRSTVYGLFLFALQSPDFWPAAFVQAAATVWILHLTLRAYGFGNRPSVLFSVTALLAVSTSLPWLSAILLTDIFGGIALLALHLLLFRPQSVSQVERYGLILLIGFSTATHSATLMMLLAMLCVAGLAAIYDRAVTLRAMAQGVAAILLGCAMLLAANFALSGRLAWTPGGYGIVFARMMQDGIVKRFLDEHCQDGRFKLCPYRNDFPETADEFLWGNSVFNKLGRFAGLDDEMRTIVIESLRAYPMWQVKEAVRAFAVQIVQVESGEGVINQLWHTYGIMEHYTPSHVKDMRAARQQRGEISFGAINRIHVPIALASFALLFGLLALGWRRAQFRDLGWLAASTLVAILANDAICAIISNPHARYGARLAWVGTLVIILAGMRSLPDHARTLDESPLR